MSSMLSNERIETFRASIVDMVTTALARQPGSALHLMYCPELADPLSVIGDTRRKSHPVLKILGQEKWPASELTRVITMDCRAVAPYLLESDPGLDDPLFEASITQAHAEICLGACPDAQLSNDCPTRTERSVCGWWIGTDSAMHISRRVGDFSSMSCPAPNRLLWPRWYSPFYVDALWPTMTPLQKQALLGKSTWVTHDTLGRLRVYTVPPSHVYVEETLSAGFFEAHSASGLQGDIVDNTPVVKLLVLRWKALRESKGQSLPLDAVQQLHEHAHFARRYLLDAEDLMFYVMTAVQLPPGVARSPEWVHLLQEAKSLDIPLREHVHTLPNGFWEQARPTIRRQTDRNR